MNSRSTILERFLALGVREGVLIEKKVFWNIFGIEEPQGVMDIREAEKRTFAFMSCMEALRQDLLELTDDEGAPCGADLQSVGRRRWRLVPREERVAEAIKDTKSALLRDLEKGSRRIKATDVRNLSWEARAARDAALTKFGHVKAAIKARA